MADPVKPLPTSWPVLPAIIAAIAVLIMVALGLWQLDRKAEKEAMLARFAAAQDAPPIAYPVVPVASDLPFYRVSRVMCVRVMAWRTVSGSSATGEPGFAHLAACQTGGSEGPGALVAVGWSKRPTTPKWNGGIVAGIIAPDNAQLIKLVATTPVAGLALLAKPSPDNIPNNHFLYAIQWFFFAAAAALIAFLAIRKKVAGAADH
jgi:surfeit locus 1 family protein